LRHDITEIDKYLWSIVMGRVIEIEKIIPIVRVILAAAIVMGRVAVVVECSTVSAAADR